MLPDRGRGRYQFIPGLKGRAPNPASKDTWTSKEKLYLLDAVQLQGENNWSEVSKLMLCDEIKKETKKNEECFSPPNCHRQYHAILETVGKEIRKKGEDKNLFTAVRQHFVDERLKELESLASYYRTKCVRMYKSEKLSKGETLDDVVDDCDDDVIVSAEGNGDINTIVSSDNNSLPVNNRKSVLTNPVSQQTATSDGSDTQTVGITEEVDDDLSDLMDILPLPMNELDADEIDPSIMETIDMSSPSDSAIKRALATTAISNPKFSPQLKNLVHSAIAGTSEPRNVSSSPGSSSAPTLSMLLQMPFRDPGQPLPEISTVSKAAQNTLPLESPTKKLPLLLVDQINKSRFSPLTSPDKNNSSDSQSPNKSSSPTLKRLLEVTKDEDGGQSKSLHEVSFVTDVVNKVMEVEIKKEQIVTTPTMDVNVTEGSSSIKTELGDGEVDANQIYAVINNQISSEQVPRVDSDAIKLKVEKRIRRTQGPIVLKSKSTDAVTPNTGTVMSTKLGTKESSNLDAESVNEISNVREYMKEPNDSQDIGETKMKIESGSNSVKDENAPEENIVAGGETIILEPPILSAHDKNVDVNVKVTIVKVTAQASETSKHPKATEGNEKLPSIVGDIVDSDDGDDSRKKVLIPAKTYSRKERFENMEIEDEDDSSSSTFNTSVKRKSQSPSRVTSPIKSPKKVHGDVVATKVERRGRKPLTSESKSIDKANETSDDETRVTRARAKSSPAPSPSRTPIQDDSSTQQNLDSVSSLNLESNPSSPSITTSTNAEEDNEHRRFRRNIHIVLDQIKSHKYAGIFLKPITAPSYLKVVKRPMDLSTIKKNLDSGQIRNVVAFERDVLLMFVNAIMYNSETTETYKMTKQMEMDVRGMLMNYKMTHGLLPHRLYQDSSSFDLSSTPTPIKPKGKRGRKAKIKTPSQEVVETPVVVEQQQPTAESGESESEIDDVEPDKDKGKRKERESSPDIVDGHGDTKRRSLRMSGNQR